MRVVEAEGRARGGAPRQMLAAPLVADVQAARPPLASTTRIAARDASGVEPRETLHHPAVLVGGIDLFVRRAPHPFEGV